MSYPFNIDKAIQAASVLLSHQEHKRMEFIRLLKLLYIADREAVRETGRPIVGSGLAALRLGPLHSRVYNLVKGEDIDAPKWADYFQTVGAEIHQTARPGVGALSPYEVRKLREVYDQYANMGTWELVEETHQFEEWTKNYPNPKENTSRPIPFEDLVRAVGAGDELRAIQDDIREACEMERLFR